MKLAVVVGFVAVALVATGFEERTVAVALVAETAVGIAVVDIVLDLAEIVAVAQAAAAFPTQCFGSVPHIFFD